MPLTRLLTAALLARTADAAGAVVLVLASVRLTGGPAQGALVLAAMLVPHVLAGPFVGLVTDRARRPRLVHAGFAALFGVSLGGVLLMLGRAPLPATLGLALVAGCCGPMIFGGLSSRLDDVVAEPRRAQARGLDAATYNVAEIAGPAAGAVLVTVAGVPAAAAALTAGCLLAALCLLTVDGAPHVAAPHTAAPRGSFRADLRAGFTAVLASRPLRAVTAATCLASYGMGMLTPVAVVLGVAAGHAAGGGLLVTALGAGALAGSLLVARFPVRRWPPHRLALGCLLAAGIAFAAVPLMRPWPLLVAWFAVAGFFDGPLLSAVLQVRSTHAPRQARTQVFTLGAGLKLTAAALGAASFTLLAAAPTVLLVAVLAASQLLAAALGAALLGHLSAASSRRSTVPPVVNGSSSMGSNPARR